MTPEYDLGDEVRLPVLENGVRRSKKMIIVKVQQKEGRWMYQVKPFGQQSGPVHKDENGRDWFAESALDFW